MKTETIPAIENLIELGHLGIIPSPVLLNEAIAELAQLWAVKADLFEALKAVSVEAHKYGMIGAKQIDDITSTIIGKLTEK